MDEAKQQRGRILRTVMALLLVALLVPLTTPYGARANEDATNSKDAEIASLLSAGEYVEGEVLVVVDNAVAQNGPRTRGVDILANAEPLMSVSGETYATATGESLPLEEAPANGPALLRSARALPTDNSVSVALLKQGDTSTEELLRQLQDDPRVLFAEPNYVYTVSDPEREASEERIAALTSALGLDSQATPNTNGGTVPTSNNCADLSSYQWGCSNTGTTRVDENAPVLTDFDINPPSWNTPGATNADGVVAIVDTGIDYNHPDLKGVMHDMTQYNLSRGGQYGFNAIANAADPTNPMDDHHHGTHCAGIVAAAWDGHGISGVASGVELVAVKAGNEEGRFALGDIVVGYDYLAEAVDKGLNLKAINDSWGGTEMGMAFSIAAAKLGEKGAISLVASGNESTDLDKNPGTGTALVGNPYVVVVDASTAYGKLASFSNYGVETTDVVAPGEAILSTMPLSQSSYMPEADANPLIYETFDKDTPAVQVYSDPNLTHTIGAVTKNASHYDDDNNNTNGALEVPIKDMAIPQQSDPSIDFRTAYVSIPVSNEEQIQNKAAYVGMHLLTSPRKKDVAYAQFKIKTSKGMGWTEFGAVMVDCSGGWANLTVQAQSLAKASEGELAFIDGKLQMGLILARVGEDFGPDDVLYLDTIGVGKEDSVVAYKPSSGTSMATPMVTGGAMVLAKRTEASAPSSPAERAAALAALVKASVRPADTTQDFSNLCASGGQIDLNPALSALTPVISNARVDTSTSPARIVIEGSYFGSAQGTVTISGKDAPVVAGSWSDTSLAVECPSGIKSGVLVIEVTSKDNTSGKRGFLLELPETPGSESTPLFEKTIPLPTPEEGLSASITGAVLCGLNGSLYMLPFDAATRKECYTKLWRYDPADSSWTHCATLPEALASSASMITYGGKLYIYGEKDVDANASPRLFSYDPPTGAWQSHPAAHLPLHATLVNCADELLLVGGAQFVAGTGGMPDRWAESTQDNIATYNPKTGEVAVTGTLLYPTSTPVVAVRGADMYVTQGNVFDPTGTPHPNANLERITKSGGRYVLKDMTGMLPPFAPNYSQQFTAAATKDGLILVGFAGTDDEDTYLLDLAHNSTAFQGLGKRMSRAPLYYPVAAAYNGWLYTLGFSSYEPDGRVMRATPVETLLQPGDVTPGPDKDDASTVARTGDTLGVAAATLVSTAIGALACAAVALQRKIRPSTDLRR